MKNILYILLLISYGCNNQAKNIDKTDNAYTAKQSLATHKKYNSKFYVTKDTLLIVSEDSDTLNYSKDEFNKIVDNHPELFKDYPQDPDFSYYCSGDKGDFGSEVGQDTYYLLYAQLLKKKNGINKFTERRKKLIDIYHKINSLFGHFQDGGTYFGHQYSRIFGYAEYSIYLYSRSKDNIEKTYDIAKQRDIYIESLRQMIDDESKINNETLENEKIKQRKELNKTVDELDKLITDNFYLRRAQEFHYRHYEYY